MKQFKEQLKSGTIQFEEDGANHTNNHAVMDIMTSSTSEGILDTFNETTTDTHNETVPNNPIQESNSQVLFTNLVEETQLDDSSMNQFEYFLLLPPNAETSMGIGCDARNESEQFIVNDEQLNFANLQFIQLDQSSLLEMQNSQTIQSMPHFRSNDNLSIVGVGQLSDLDQTMDSNVECVANMGNVPATETAETTINTASTESNVFALTNKKSTRQRKSTKSINKCDTCAKVFQKPIDLRRHIRTHTLEKVILKISFDFQRNLMET